MAKIKISDDKQFYKDRDEFLKKFKKKEPDDKAGKAAREAAGLKEEKK